MQRAARVFATLGLLCTLLPAGSAAQAAEPATLTIFAAGTLAVPFKEIAALFEKKYPNVTVQAQFGGSVKMAKQITELHQDADLLAVADYSVIPKYLFAATASPLTPSGTSASRATRSPSSIPTRASTRTRSMRTTGTRCWPGKGVEIGRSNPDTDPSGYQTVQMLDLAEKYYNAARPVSRTCWPMRRSPTCATPRPR